MGDIHSFMRSFHGGHMPFKRSKTGFGGLNDQACRNRDGGWGIGITDIAHQV